MAELPGEPVKCWRNFEVFMDGYSDLELKVPVSFHYPDLGQDGFLRILDCDGVLYSYNPAFVVRMWLEAEIYHEELKKKDSDDVDGD